MLTLSEIHKNVLSIREAVNSIQVRGKENAEFVIYAISKCDELINGVLQTAEDLSKNQNGVEEVDEKVNGDNSNITKTD